MAGTLTLSAKATPFPFAAVAIASYTQKAEISYEESVTGVLLDLDGSKITSEDEAVKALAKAGGMADDSAKSTAYFILAGSLARATGVPDIVSVLDSLDDHLAYRTFLIGHDITGSDWIVWGALKGNLRVIGLLRNGLHKHLLRWSTHLESLGSTQAVLLGLTEAKASKARTNQKTAASFALGLEGAKEGEVVTRFPPEPSGYLHIGHAKAAILNQYFAQMYKGKLLIRFDDTNPAKERSEFEETILEDLALMGIQGDKVSHTSDYFDHLYDLAIQMIKSGNAYADDTEQAQMREERMDGIASKRRGATVDENLARLAEMKLGSEEGLRWCLRAKMSVDNPNKAMRDPVIYRCNLTPHHRTGDKWKVYPTYDFACPVIDSLEGVTHALRTNEYRDRNPQYHWMINALGIRPVHIWDFSRLNFIYTLLSKRKLHWFVDNGIVRGWDDPRFPTVRGIRRRGMTIEALRQFMLSQGPSQAIVSLEWDSIWALNKKIIDPVAPRFWAILKDKANRSVPVAINSGPTEAEVKAMPKHKKNPDVGEKQTVYSSSIIIEQDDALSFEDNEEITLMDWGNAIVRSKTTDESGFVTSLTMDLHLEGDFRKTKKKVTWLAAPTFSHALVDATLIDYDYLITKKKLEDDDDVKDFVTPVSEFREDALADANVRALNKGDTIQFERKGYYIFDGEVDGRREFIRIPDGKAASLASKAAPLQPTREKTTPAAEIVPKKMYEVDAIYEGLLPDTSSATRMYKVDSVYGA
ncbi:glutamate-tRNA ligase [Vararia minispora EC-137]|uniref:Glutamate-tRNA ligase n=1 Tax=Vararia minispora EC-137 TaxID=1314806 RepID=A0ACB8QD61_9AGAM|nr:glutamate-tRNA ligase [Vararia minispora EC-137]